MLTLNKSVLWDLDVLTKLATPLAKEGEQLIIKNGRIVTSNMSKLLTSQKYKFVSCTFEIFVDANAESSATGSTIVLYPETMICFEGSTEMNFYSISRSNFNVEEMFFKKNTQSLGEYFKLCAEFAYLLDTNLNNKFFLPMAAKSATAHQGQLSLKINKTLNHN